MLAHTLVITALQFFSPFFFFRYIDLNGIMQISIGAVFRGLSQSEPYASFPLLKQIKTNKQKHSGRCQLKQQKLIFLI